MDKPDLSKVQVEVKWHEDMWQAIKDATLTTIGKDKGKYPDSAWKIKMLMAEHSPIRIGHIIIKIKNCPSFVITHILRHSIGVVPFISTFRSDRVDYDEVPNRNTLQDATFDINFQAFINISRKRLCNCASYETRYVWQKVLEAIKGIEPELYAVCVPECVRRNGMCPEFKSCSYNKTEKFEAELAHYQELVVDQINDQTLIKCWVEEDE